MSVEYIYCIKCGEGCATVHSYCGDCYFERLAETFSRPIEAATVILVAQLEPMKKLVEEMNATLSRLGSSYPDFGSEAFDRGE